MHTYEGCSKILGAITSNDVAIYVEDEGIEMTEQEFRELCDYISDSFTSLLMHMNKAQEWIDEYYHQWKEQR